MRTKLTVNGLTLNIELKTKVCRDYSDFQEKEMVCLSISGSKKGYGSGQCLGYIKQRILMGSFNPRLTKAQTNEVLNIINIWEKYHLNDMKAGTINQEKFIKENYKGAYDYNKVCELLKENNLLEDVYMNCQNYKYGTSWLCEEIPTSVIDSLMNSIENLQNM